jgi:hypothetical protein
VSPFAGYGSTAALTFVLLAAAIKAVIEDKKRHEQDFETNNSSTTVMRFGACSTPYPRCSVRSLAA